MADCLFCKIIAGEIPNYTVYENDHVLAFLDIHPCTKGHTVVVPKQHVNSLLEMEEEHWQQTMHGVRLAMKRVQQVLNPEAMNIGINERSAAGQTVPHVHWHILPRWEGDGGGSVHSIIRNGNAGEVKEVAELFK